MRCHICNKSLEPEEVRYVEKMVGHRFGPFDPCGKCLLYISEVFEDHDEENVTLLPEEDNLDMSLVEFGEIEDDL